jgi:hypothetical protein
MERSEGFVAEGQIEISPKEEFFTFLDGEHLGKLLVRTFGLPGELGYCDLGRVRLTVERLEETQT